MAKRKKQRYTRKAVRQVEKEEYRMPVQIDRLICNVAETNTGDITVSFVLRNQK